MAKLKNKTNIKAKSKINKSTKKNEETNEINTKVVNDNGEIIFDGDEALNKALNNLSGNKMLDISLPEIATEALKEVKNASKVAENVNMSNPLSSRDVINETLDKLTDLEQRLSEDINKKITSLTNEQKDNLSKTKLFDLGRFWSGISNGWD